MLEPEVTIKVKESSHHPLEKYVQPVNANKLKFYHNAINNPKYPVKPEKTLTADIQFTVIGSFLTKEFIESVHTVNVFHRYRKKTFKVPIVKGVTGVEWPAVCNEIKNRYGGTAYCLKGEVAILINEQFLGGIAELRDYFKTKYTYNVTIDYNKRSIEDFVKFVRNSKRPCAYMHIAIDKVYVGTLIFMVYVDWVPITCENFLRLCNLQKGGYGGTPVHRIVKDGWIQCGGFGLKSVSMPCENYSVPHDRRGVLCMANDGRSVDNSTQFFVLLQPAKWMAHKYVAFGQLIDGEETLKKIENIPTYYESPLADVCIMRSGILNQECQDIRPNVGATEFCEGHVEDLIELFEMIKEWLYERMWIEIEFRELIRLQRQQLQGEDAGEEEESKTRLKKRIMEGKGVSFEDNEEGQRETLENKNAEFAVEEYEPEEYSYQHVSVGDSDMEVKQRQPFYIEMTDVLYPGEKDSEFDFKRFLKGYYCLESDLPVQGEEDKEKEKVITKDDFFYTEMNYEDSPSESPKSLDSEDETEIKKWLKINMDRVSFAGEVIRGIAKGSTRTNYCNYEQARKSELINPDILQKFRLSRFSAPYSAKKVLIYEPELKHSGVLPHTFARRQTGFIRTTQNTSPTIISASDDREEIPQEALERKKSKEVRLAPPHFKQKAISECKIPRKPTGNLYSVVTQSVDHDIDRHRQSVLTRLYENVAYDNEEKGPTLKNHKPIAEIQLLRQKNLLLTYTPTHLHPEDNSKEKYVRLSRNVESSKKINLQHGDFERNISADFITDHHSDKPKTSVRSVHFARVRPTLTVSQYKLKCQRKDSADSKI